MDAKMEMRRREFLLNSGLGLGALAVGAMTARAAGASPIAPLSRPPRAKRVIYLFQAGAPSQVDLFEDKPRRSGVNKNATAKKSARSRRK